MILTWTGASQVGKAPLVSSIINAVNLSKVPNIALWRTTGVCFSPLLSMYDSSKFLGNNHLTFQEHFLTSY